MDTSDNPEDLGKYSNRLLAGYTGEYLIYFPDPREVLDWYIVATDDFFNRKIINDKIHWDNMPLAR